MMFKITQIKPEEVWDALKGGAHIYTVNSMGAFKDADDMPVYGLIQAVNGGDFDFVKVEDGREKSDE